MKLDIQCFETLTCSFIKGRLSSTLEVWNDMVVSIYECLTTFMATWRMVKECITSIQRVARLYKRGLHNYCEISKLSSLSIKSVILLMYIVFLIFLGLAVFCGIIIENGLEQSNGMDQNRTTGPLHATSILAENLPWGLCRMTSPWSIREGLWWLHLGKYTCIYTSYRW